MKSLDIIYEQEVRNPVESSIAINEFAKRQVKTSKYAHFEGSWDELVQLIKDHFASKKESPNRKGVIYITVPPVRFFSSIVEVNAGTQLKATFAARREGEAPYIQVEAVGTKAPAKIITIVLYSHDLLAKDNEQSTDADWEVVSINSGSSDEPTPPMAMARNQLGLLGGTQASYSAQDFADSLIYWSTKVPVAG